MKFGIPQKSIDMIQDALAGHPEIDEAFIFGSRAIGNYKNGSDIDLVIFGDEIKTETINKLSIQLNEELPLPYYFDIVHYQSLKNIDMLKHIDRFGKRLYKTNPEKNI